MLAHTWKEDKLGKVIPFKQTTTSPWLDFFPVLKRKGSVLKNDNQNWQMLSFTECMQPSQIEGLYQVETNTNEVLLLKRAKNDVGFRTFHLLATVYR